MYRVGFGDFFLLTVPGTDGPKHILIDCGVHAKDIGTIQADVAQMAQETQSKLALVIMTHRHADHISGFGKCKDVFANFEVERVWMSWFENPGDKRAMALQAGVVAVASQLQHALAARSDPAAQQYLNMVQNITGNAAAAAGNDVALQVLHGFKGSPPIDYYQAGDKANLPQSLIDAGLTAQILGPPIDQAMISKMDNTNQEYLAANDTASAGAAEPFAGAYRMAPAQYTGFNPTQRTEMEKRILAVQPDTMAAKADQANNFINNQSLVVLFTFNGKTMLFAGDAQWGNWANFLFGSLTGTALKPEAKDILGKLDFYKVGHHGSKNATPKDALAAMRDGCVAMCSTALDAYHDVPRDPLVAAIEQKTKDQLARSDMIAAGATAKDARAGDLPASGIFKPQSTSAYGYIDYQF